MLQDHLKQKSKEKGMQYMIDSDDFRLEILKRTDALHRLAGRIDLEGVERIGRDKVQKEIQEVINSLEKLNHQLAENR